MQIMGIKVNDYGICEPCIMAKSKRQRSTIPASTTRSKVRNGLVHIDPAGPITPPGILYQHQYFTIFTSDHSRFRTGVTSKTRAEIPGKFKDYNTKETLAGFPVLAIHTDNAGEFTSKKFAHYCGDNGVLQQMSADRTPEQNGVAERSIGIITPKMKCAMLAAGAPPGLWSWAFLYTCDMVNITPGDHECHQTPYELHFGFKPSMEHLRMWGSTVHVQTKEPETQKKLASLTKLHIFIGYVTEDSQIYQVMNPETLYIRTSRHLTFLENDFSAMEILRNKMGITEAQCNTSIEELEFTGIYTSLSLSLLPSLSLSWLCALLALCALSVIDQSLSSLVIDHSLAHMLTSFSRSDEHLDPYEYLQALNEDRLEAQPIIFEGKTSPSFSIYTSF